MITVTNSYSKEVNKCNEFASLEYVEILEDINAKEAIKHCSRYVNKFPNKQDYVWQLARAYYAGKDYANSLKYNRKAIELGSVMAINNLGIQYELGLGIKKNISKAIELYKQAMSKGNSHAMLNLGFMYEEGNSVIEQNIDEAIRLYGLAAQNGDSYGSHYIGLVYNYGIGLKINYERANQYFEKAIKKKNRDSMHSLAINFFYGLGLNVNKKKAYELLSNAIALGNSDSMVMKAELYYENEKNYTKSLELLKKAEKLNNSDAMNKIGYFYEFGWVSGKKDYEKAIKYYNKAANLDHADAINNLGVLYEEGTGVQQDINLSISYYKKAIDLDSTYAANNLAVLYMFGDKAEKNVEKAQELLLDALEISKESLTYFNLAQLFSVKKDYEKMVSYYKEAIKIDNDSDSLYALGVAYEYGEGVEKNDKKAFELILKASKQDNIDAINWIGAAYYGGIGIPRNINLAIKYYKEASDKGDTFAMNNLGNIYQNGEMDIDIDYKKAYKFYEKSSSFGNFAGTYFLAELYKDGLGIVPNLKKAFNLYKEAGNGGDLLSMVTVGDFYRLGQGIDINIDKSKVWYLKALNYIDEDNSNYLNNNLGFKKIALAQANSGLSILQNINKNIYSDLDFGDYHAVLIGNQTYSKLNNLNNSINDVRSIKHLLENQYNYKVTLIEDANEEQIWKHLYNLRKLNENDRLLIYYSGHGIIDKETDIGYWLPTDADPQIPNRWISDIDIKSNLRAIKAKHVMIIADSCFSGSLLRDTSKINVVDIKKKVLLQKLLEKKIRVALTSGGEEPVLDSGGGKHSIFAKHLIDILESNSQIITGNTVFNKLKEQLILNATQTPVYNFIQNSGSEINSDYIFVPKKFFQ